MQNTFYRERRHSRQCEAEGIEKHHSIEGLPKNIGDRAGTMEDQVAKKLEQNTQTRKLHGGHTEKPLGVDRSGIMESTKLTGSQELTILERMITDVTE